MGLLDIPRALFAKCAGKLMQLHHLSGNGLYKLRNVQSGEVIGGKHAIQFLPRCVLYALIGQAQVMQQHNWLVADSRIECQFHIGEHPVGMCLRNKQRPAFARRLNGEAVAVNEAHSGIDRVDTKSIPSQIQKTHGRQNRNSYAGIGSQRSNTRLQNQWRTRNRIQNFAVFNGRRNKLFGDC